jgi:hypothetical protein
MNLMAFDIERLIKHIPNGDGYNSEFTHDLEEAVNEIKRLRGALKVTLTTLEQISEIPRSAGAKRNASATVKFLQALGTRSI